MMGSRQTIVFCFLLWYSLLTLLVDAEVQHSCMVDKQTGHADCKHNNLTYVPNDLPSETRILDLTLNSIRNLNASAFRSYQFLTHISLAKNDLASISYATFSHLNDLKVLDVSHNRLSHFHVDIPIFVEALYLNNNPLMGGFIFQQRLIYIKYLSLAGTNMTQPSVFSSFLPTLEYLDLRDIPNLKLNATDVKKLRQLSTLYVSPRMFSGRDRSQKCREFVKAAREFKTEVKAFTCFPETKFTIKANAFERAYQVDDALNKFDRPDNVLNVKDASSLSDLQILVSNGATNFVKSILVEKDQMPQTVYKIKDPVSLEDYSLPLPSGTVSLTAVQMNGFPAIRPWKPSIVEMATSDAEELKRYQVSYKTDETARVMSISGNYRAFKNAGNFTCEFTHTNFESTRQMLRRYDFLVWPTTVKEVLKFQTMDCSINNPTRSDVGVQGNVADAVMKALSSPWLDSVTNIVNAISLDPAIYNVSRSFTEMYRERVLSKVIGSSLDYLKNINVDSFDVAPSFSASPNDTQVELLLQNQYNVKIVNFFNYTDTKIKYQVKESASSGKMKIIGEYSVFYEEQPSSTMITISPKDDPKDQITVVIKSIEFDVHFEVDSVNQVHRFAVSHVNARVIETRSAGSTNFLYLVFKKYLDFQLSKELSRSLKYLTSKVDFYSLNAL